MTALLHTPLHLHERRDVWLPASVGFRVHEPDAPAIKNPDRRRACRFDLVHYKRSYFPWFKDTGTFHPQFLPILQRKILSAGIVKKALAAPRGIAKTYDTVIAASWALAYGHRKYIPWICRKIEYAIDRVGMLQHIFRNNAILREDFPELCLPFVGTTAQQVKAPCKMSAEEFVLPNLGASLSYSIESALRGLILDDGSRPDWVILDDVIETAAGSEKETNNLITVIEENLGGLAELGGNLFELMLATIPTVGCVSDIYTLQAKKPGWDGQRFKAMLSKPERQDLWERFREICGMDPAGEELKKLIEEFAALPPIDVPATIGMREKEFNSNEIKGHRVALEYFARNFDAMMAGCEMLDPSRLPVHFYYSQMVYESPAFVAGEYDQEPLPSEHQVVTELKIERLLIRCIGPKARIVPEWAVVLLASIDVGSDVKKGLHWCVDAFGAQGQSCMIECGIETVLGVASTMIDNEALKIATLESALREALKKLRDYLMQGFVKPSTGELLMPALIGIDVRGTMKNYAWQPLLVNWCQREENARRWRPMLGQEWKPTMIAQAREDGILNGQWYRQTPEKGGLYLRNSDYWITQLNEAHTLTPLDANGAVMPKARIFHAECPRRFLHHQCNYEHHAKQADDTESKLKEGWKQKNHQPVDFGDASAMNQNLYQIWKVERGQQQRPPRPASTPRPRPQNPMYS